MPASSSSMGDGAAPRMAWQRHSSPGAPAAMISCLVRRRWQGRGRIVGPTATPVGSMILDRVATRSVTTLVGCCYTLSSQLAFKLRTALCFPITYLPLSSDSLLCLQPQSDASLSCQRRFCFSSLDNDQAATGQPSWFLRL